ncbi:hypothetical protein NDU88_002035 [Pleurodeles waltl]|uniref:Uncharacterized protein n=1 Tax=Pleurodeles waltl TaxID=8319 RepID=A0AAV7Q4U3_PLEWA|nr:hypothetical protein NDU88_002035 [Pleurodeles waltl]
MAPPSAGALRFKAAPVRNQRGGRQAQHRLHAPRADRHSCKRASSASGLRCNQSPSRTGADPTSTRPQ